MAQGSVRVYEPSLRTLLVLDNRYGLSTRLGVPIRKSQSIWTLYFSNTLLISSTAFDGDSNSVAFYIV
jgi:hypothetical protein